MATAAPPAGRIAGTSGIPSRLTSLSLSSRSARARPLALARGGDLAPFRERSESELAALTDEELLGYLVDARLAGREQAAILAARILAFKHQRALLAFVANKLPDLPGSVQSEIAEKSLCGAIEYAENFSGTSLGEFRSIVFLIARRRIDDHWRKRYPGDEQVHEDSLEQKAEREEGQGWEPLVDDPAEGRIEFLDKQAIFKRALGELKQDSHKMVILLVKFKGLRHREAADFLNEHHADKLEQPMTETNVSKILSRFDTRLDQLLGESDDSPGDEDDGTD